MEENSKNNSKKKFPVAAVVIAIALVAVIAAVVCTILLLPKWKYDSAIKQANALAEDGEFEEAIEKLKDAKKIEVSENQAEELIYETYLTWAKKQMKKEDYEGAIESCNEAIDVDKTKKAVSLRNEAYLALGRRSLEDKKFDQALDYVALILKDDAENESAINLMYEAKYEKALLEEEQQKKLAEEEKKRQEEEEKRKRDEEFNSPTITLWCTFTEDSVYRRSFEKALEDMKKDYPYVTVNWEAYEQYAYNTKLKAAVAANELPDVFICPPSQLQNVAYSGRAYRVNGIYDGYRSSVNNIYENYRNELPQVMMDMGAVDGRYYGVPFLMNSVTMYYNWEVLRQAGYEEIPSTIEEFQKCCDALLELGVTPIACAQDETWCVEELLETMILKNMGAKDLKKLFEGKASWNDQRIADAVDVYRLYVLSGYVTGPDNTSYNDQVRADFVDGKYAFYVQGSWNALDFSTYAPDKILVTQFPVIDRENVSSWEYLAVPAGYFMISQNTKNPELIAEYVFELSKRLAQYGTADFAGIPCWIQKGIPSYLGSLIADITYQCQTATDMVIIGDTYMDADVAYIYLEHLAELRDGITGEEFIERMSRDIQ